MKKILYSSLKQQERYKLSNEDNEYYEISGV